MRPWVPNMDRSSYSKPYPTQILTALTKVVLSTLGASTAGTIDLNHFLMVLGRPGIDFMVVL